MKSNKLSEEPKEITRSKAILLMVQYAQISGWSQFSNDELQEMLIENGNNVKIVEDSKKSIVEFEAISGKKRNIIFSISAEYDNLRTVDKQIVIEKLLEFCLNESIKIRKLNKEK